MRRFVDDWYILNNILHYTTEPNNLFYSTHYIRDSQCLKKWGAVRLCRKIHVFWCVCVCIKILKNRMLVLLLHVSLSDLYIWGSRSHITVNVMPGSQLLSSLWNVSSSSLCTPNDFHIISVKAKWCLVLYCEQLNAPWMQSGFEAW